MTDADNTWIEEKVRSYFDAIRPENEYANGDDGFGSCRARSAEWIEAALTETWNKSRLDAIQEMEGKIEAAMLKRIYYIGHDLPQVKEDVRDKFVLLGTPAQFLKELAATLSTLAAQAMRQEKGV